MYTPQRVSPSASPTRSHHKAPGGAGGSGQQLLPASRDEFSDVKDMLARVQSTQNQLVSTIEVGSSMGYFCVLMCLGNFENCADLWKFCRFLSIICLI